MATLPSILLACIALCGCAAARPCECCAAAELPLAAFEQPSTTR